MIDSIVDKHVKCVLRNGMVIEGIVVEWSESRVVLKSLDGESLMIVHKPADDILMTKVVLVEESSEIVKEIPQPTEMQQQIKAKLKEVQQSNDQELQNKSVDELRQMVLEQERQIIAQKKKEHFGTAGAAKMTRYSSPYMPARLPNTPGAQMPSEKRSAYLPRKPCKNNAD